MSNLSECSPACNCMCCRLSQDSSIAFSAHSDQTNPVTPPNPVSPQIERFSDLPDGTEFYLAQTYAYGGRQLYQKIANNNGLHNAVLCTDSYFGIRVNDLQLVIRK